MKPRQKGVTIASHQIKRQTDRQSSSSSSSIDMWASALSGRESRFVGSNPTGAIGDSVFPEMRSRRACASHWCEVGLSLPRFLPRGGSQVWEGAPLKTGYIPGSNPGHAHVYESRGVAAKHVGLWNLCRQFESGRDY